MRQSTKRKIEGISVCVFIIIIIFSVVFWLNSIPTHKEEIKCYDRFSNEIKGAVCYNEVIGNEWLDGFKILSPMLLIFIPLFLVLAMLILIN